MPKRNKTYTYCSLMKNKNKINLFLAPQDRNKIEIELVSYIYYDIYLK